MLLDPGPASLATWSPKTRVTRVGEEKSVLDSIVDAGS